MPKEELIPTRPSLLKRIANWDDQASWQDFFKTYRNLIYGVARRAGLTDAEAQDVVQETMIAVSRHIESFSYDPGIGSFKSWLLNMTRWRIVDQLRRRVARGTDFEEGKKIDCAEPLASDGRESFDDYWEEEWQRALLETAKMRIKQRIDPAKYQIFDLYVTKELPPKKVAERMGITVNDVYLAKHRITQLIKEEVRRLEKGGD